MIFTELNWIFYFSILYTWNNDKNTTKHSKSSIAAEYKIHD